jgi:hypothetical protein
MHFVIESKLEKYLLQECIGTICGGAQNCKSYGGCNYSRTKLRSNGESRRIEIMQFTQTSRHLLSNYSDRLRTMQGAVAICAALLLTTTACATGQSVPAASQRTPNAQQGTSIGKAAASTSHQALNNETSSNSPQIGNLDPNRRKPDPHEKQVFTKEQSKNILSPSVRALLDVMLRLYDEPGLITDRQKVLDLLEVKSSNRQWSTIEPVKGSYRSYIDQLASEGLVGYTGWLSTYGYTGKREPWIEMWSVGLAIQFDRKPQGSGCINSRAVEGYLNLVLDPGLFGSAHPRSNLISLHQHVLASPFAKRTSPLTPTLSMQFSNGCLLKIAAGDTFEIMEINDAHAHDQ